MTKEQIVDLTGGMINKHLDTIKRLKEKLEKSEILLDASKDAININRDQFQSEIKDNASKYGKNIGKMLVSIHKLEVENKDLKSRLDEANILVDEASEMITKILHKTVIFEDQEEWFRGDKMINNPLVKIKGLNKE